MREIKFRARTLRKGEWVYGYYWTNELGNHFIKNTIDEETGMFVLEDYEVDGDTVGQYTGLKDKSGTEVYEGDIVKCRWLAELGITEIDCESFGVVNWQDDICMFYIDFAKPFITHPCEDGRYAEDGMALEKTVDGFTKNEFSIDYEVTGNIFEHKYLLEGEKND